ncbi:hypothetical protein B7494_g7250 [Chlorociboria aeruginascens]|nr:hypothetical protein B7494_g7250 [Chlorociboria aeruginascens]
MDHGSLPEGSNAMELSYPIRTRRTGDLPPKLSPKVEVTAKQSNVSKEEEEVPRHLIDEDDKSEDITSVLDAPSSSSAESSLAPSSQIGNCAGVLERLLKLTDMAEPFLHKRSLLARLSDSSTYANPDICMPPYNGAKDFDENHPMLADVDELEVSEAPVTMRDYQVWCHYRWKQRRGWWYWTPSPLRTCITAIRYHKEE